MTAIPSADFLLTRWVKPQDFKDIFVDYSRYNTYDASLFDENGKLNKRMNLLPLDEKVYQTSVLDNLHHVDRILAAIDKKRAALFPLFTCNSPVND